MKIKNILLVLVLALTASNAYSSEWKEKCKSISELAEMIMQSRQDGESMAKMIDSTGDGPNNLIIAAYDKPRYSTKKHQQRTIEDFRDSVYLECVKKLR